MAGIKDKFSVDGIKTFFLKHGEKVILAGVVLFVVMSLVGTQWSTYKKVPGELTEKLSKADQVIEKGSPWPDEEKEKYPDFSPKAQVEQMLANMSSAPFTYSTPFWTPPGGQKEPFKEPIYVAVEDLIASPGRTMLAQNNDEEEEMDSESDDDEEMTTDDEDDDDDTDDDFAKRKTSGNNAATNIAAGIPSSGLGLGFGRNYEREITSFEDPNAMLVNDFNEASEGEEGGSGMGIALPDNVKGVPVRYISVRGIFDLRKQVLNYAHALQTDITSAENLVKFMDFKLERQVADSPEGPWDGEWETIDISVAKDYLTNTIDLDQDPVSQGVRDPVITMPLPTRLMGVWRNKVNHPRIKKYELSDEEMEAEAALNRKIIEEFRKNRESIVQEIPPGGFADQQLNMAQYQDRFLDDERNQKVLGKEFEELFGEDSKIDTQKLIEKIKEQVDAVGNLVLFRYIDFDIEPGKSYRYRVQLVLRNPNYGAPVDQVNTPAVAEGQLRETPVSEPSNVASVAEDYAYFLSMVRPPRGVANEIAEMLVYEWFDESGTLIKGKLAMELGDYIGGKQKTYVLRPDKMTFEQEDDVPFKSEDLLIDAMFVGRLDRNLHSDLKTPPGLSRHESGIPPEALVLDREGRLKEIDPISLASVQKKYESNYQREKEPFEDLKGAKEKSLASSDANSLLDPDAAEMSGGGVMEEMMQAGVGAAGLRGRKRNASRLKGIKSPRGSSRGSRR